MIRKIFIPKDDKLTIRIPKEYIGREIEFLMFPIDKISQNPQEPKALNSSTGSNQARQKERGGITWADFIFDLI